MKYEELVNIVKQETGKRIVSKLLGHIAYQFNVEGEAEGAFYLEVDGGRINVEPYEYYDRDMIIVTTAEVIVQMAVGKLEPMEAYTNGLLKAYGDEDYLKLLPLGKHKNKE